MKKKYFFVLIILFILFIRVSANAETIFDTSNTSSGILYITYDGSLSKKIKLTVELSGSTEKYVYNVTSNKKFSVPLQLGNGEYTVSMLENVSGQSYRILAKNSFKADIKTPNNMFLTASPIVNYTSDMEVIKAYDTLLKGKENENTSNLYERVVNDYYYDYNKASNPPVEYVPNIEEIYKSKKAICYDYSAIMSSVLRHKSIPTKLVMGYAPEVEGYHAWNEIYIDGSWVVVDTTYDSVYAHAGLKYSMKKDGSKFKVVKVY